MTTDTYCRHGLRRGACCLQCLANRPTVEVARGDRVTTDAPELVGVLGTVHRVEDDAAYVEWHARERLSVQWVSIEALTVWRVA